MASKAGSPPTKPSWTRTNARLVECPICADCRISRLPSAPRLNLSGVTQAQPAASGGGAEVPVPQVTTAPSMQLQWLKAVRHMMENTEDVGERFALEARRIHYGEIEARGIRGQASAEERRSLHE